MHKMSLRRKKSGSGGSGEFSYSNETIPEHKFVEKLTRALVSVSEGVAETLVASLETICKILMHRYVPTFVEDHKAVLVERILKSIRQGKGAEQLQGVNIAPLLVLQLAGDRVVSKTLNKYLLVTVQDINASFRCRAKCCSALGLLNFLDGGNNCDLLPLMQLFESIFKGSFWPDNSKTLMLVTPEKAPLHVEALTAWALLLTLLPACEFVHWMTKGRPLPPIEKLMRLLHSPHLSVRIIAGETLALILEHGYSHNKSFLAEHLDDLITTVKELIKETRKYQSKRERKTQRVTFKCVLRYLQGGKVPGIDISLGSETLTLDTWAKLRLYSVFSGVIGTGITAHLKQNQFIRDIFKLGPKISNDNEPVKMEKPKKGKHSKSADTDARPSSRSKNREKRIDVVN